MFGVLTSREPFDIAKRYGCHDKDAEKEHIRGVHEHRQPELEKLLDMLGMFMAKNPDERLTATEATDPRCTHPAVLEVRRIRDNMLAGKSEHDREERKLIEGRPNDMTAAPSKRAPLPSRKDPRRIQKQALIDRALKDECAKHGVEFKRFTITCGPNMPTHISHLGAMYLFKCSDDIVRDLRVHRCLHIISVGPFTLSGQNHLQQHGDKAEFEEGTQLGQGKGEPVVLGQLRRPLPSGVGMPVSVAIKRVTLIEEEHLSGQGLRQQRNEIAELQAEAKALRRMEGWPPFIRLIAANTDPSRPATLEKPDATKSKVLCIAMEPLGSDFVEGCKLFGLLGANSRPMNARAIWLRFQASIAAKSLDERAKELQQDLIVLTKALAMIVQAQRGAVSRGTLHPDAPAKNVMLPQSVLGGDRPLQPYPADNGQRLIDLASLVNLGTQDSGTTTTSSSSRTNDGPPPFLGKRCQTALVPLDPEKQRASLQIAGSTPFYRDPELILLGLEHDQPELRTTPSRCWRPGPSIEGALGQGEDVDVWEAGRWQTVEMLTISGQSDGKLFLKDGGRPVYPDGKVQSPLDNVGLAFVDEWSAIICDVVAKGTKLHEGDRLTLKEVEDRLFEALRLLEAPDLQLTAPSGHAFRQQQTASPSPPPDDAHPYHSPEDDRREEQAPPQPQQPAQDVQAVIATQEQPPVSRSTTQPHHPSPPPRDRTFASKDALPLSHGRRGPPLSLSLAFQPLLMRRRLTFVVTARTEVSREPRTRAPHQPKVGTNFQARAREQQKQEQQTAADSSRMPKGTINFSSGLKAEFEEGTQLGKGKGEPKRDITELRQEAKTMRKMIGRAPFIKLIAADTDDTKPAEYVSSDGVKMPVLCAAMEALEGSQFEEIKKVFGFLRQDLIVLTKALAMVVQAHRGAVWRGGLHQDGFNKNIMLPKAVLRGERALKPYPADNGQRMIDLANVIHLGATTTRTGSGSSSSGSSSSSGPPPRFVGKPARTALVPLDPEQQQRRGQIAGNTAFFRSPELIMITTRHGDAAPDGLQPKDGESAEVQAQKAALIAARAEVRDDLRIETQLKTAAYTERERQTLPSNQPTKQPQPSTCLSSRVPATNYDKEHRGSLQDVEDTLFALLIAEVRDDLRERWLLVGKGKEEGIWAGVPAAVHGVGLLIAAAGTLGWSIEGPVTEGEDQQLWDNTRRWQVVEMLSVSGFTDGKDFMKEDGRPNSVDGCPLDKVKLAFVQKWHDCICAIAAKATNFEEQDRGTLKDVEDALFAALKVLERAKPTASTAHTTQHPTHGRRSTF
ncbi:unnamed protein product [Vitrella brassicaformis CCMP3155]|uniref:Protein kinase domain-containing protein n=1 Tax=Vitrella brassicaformis (strain CCMP3155) TaxID=1169540 RepID=A0A0G4FGI2_VITBC|nr:unnamed protein product [Vitrella brassicaformis CCMP3155]|eukprot:CEM12428.1 unnamed protein product [Vitrella brassicaformis CCMP3155]